MKIEIEYKRIAGGFEWWYRGVFANGMPRSIYGIASSEEKIQAAVDREFPGYETELVRVGVGGAMLRLVV